MHNFLLKNLSIVQENFSFINWLKEQSEAKIEKRKCSLSHCLQVDEQFDSSSLRISFNELIQFIH